MHATALIVAIASAITAITANPLAARQICGPQDMVCGSTATFTFITNGQPSTFNPILDPCCPGLECVGPVRSIPDFTIHDVGGIDLTGTLKGPTCVEPVA